MEKQAMRNFPRSKELIEANNHEQKTSFLKKDNKKRCDSTTSVDSAIESSISSSSFSSSSSSDLMEDATSPSTSSSSSSSNGPLFQLSDLMNHLPIKRGLSKYYEGKSESFTSLACVGSLEDLAKRENPYRKNIKLCRSYFCSPKPKITKKTSFSSSTFVRKNLITSCSRYPHVQKHF